MPMSPPPEKPLLTPRRGRAGGIVVPHRPRWHQWLAAWLIVGLIKIVSATLRYRWRDESNYFSGGQRGPAIYCIWHNRLVLSMTAYYGFIKRYSHSAGLAAMVS